MHLYYPNALRTVLNGLFRTDTRRHLSQITKSTNFQHVSQNFIHAARHLPSGDCPRRARGEDNNENNLFINRTRGGLRGAGETSRHSYCEVRRLFKCSTVVLYSSVERCSFFLKEKEKKRLGFLCIASLLRRVALCATFHTPLCYCVQRHHLSVPTPQTLRNSCYGLHFNFLISAS